MATKDKLVPSQETMDKFRNFGMAMVSKYIAGMQKHGTKVVIDPIEEAQQECLDLANYAQMTYFRLEKLKEKVKAIEEK
jgi:hypothetical protein